MKYQKGELGEIENSKNVKGYLTFYPFSSLRKDTEGIWIKYKGRDNSESLQKLFKEKSIDFRKIDFKNDNIYIYYTKDDKENYTEPRIIIAIDNSYDIECVIGIGLNQGIENSMASIAEEKMQSFPGNEKYKKIAHDITLLAKLEYKTNNNIKLTKKELKFLYEIDSKIECYFYDYQNFYYFYECHNIRYCDPRIIEIRNKRNVKKDLAYVFDCKEENIGTNITDFDTNKITYYYGTLEWEKDFVPDTFKDLKRIIGGAYFSNLTNAKGLNNLCNIRGGAGFPNLTSAKGLENLRYIGGYADFKNLTNAQGLNNLRCINGTAYFDKLMNAEGLNKLQYIGNYACFSILTRAQGLNNLQYIGKNACFDNLISAKGLEKLRYIGRDAEFNSLPNAEGLNSLEYIGKNAEFPNLISAKGLDSLQIIEEMAYFPKLITSEGLGSLQSIGSEAYFYSLTSAEHLCNLKYIGFGFIFEKLKSTKGLENINIDYKDSNR